ncbi:hypothetical protein FT663_02569 [Candidozyma haemuli var. vulneris]|uniref:Uncharacterized protein n=1 Tax=Candidozyma haemuli TaxID=45357 RepID=A0A2V1AYL0_9ASCO|nr:hypothetical protein CXQ85_005012 [[Candida] haemuloni]KAF3986904.1 hypothetical protein FT662_04316 [[Candida] haemuloni var. vulneris]KAF3991818.1 hypothetical protein FT663_02569 [[Candida] haemuloni var. vulneris]PVH22443.1 hypothetical protein CXQ85_005012 [[Candida] haemuloni]
MASLDHPLLPLDKGTIFDDYSGDASSFECISIESPSSSAPSIFDELVFTDKLDLNKFLDDMASFHDCINFTFHSMAKRLDTLESYRLRHKKLLETSLDKSDAMITRLGSMKAELAEYEAFFKPVEEETEPLIEVKEYPKRTPIYSSEYIDNYVNQRMASMSEPILISYRTIVVAIIAMLLYVVCIRDRK